MRQRLAIVITIVLVIGLLIALNATSYVSTERRADSEFNPDRSTYNPGATGTRAFYDLLVETGRKVIRWRDVPGALLNTSGESRPATFVVVGETLVSFEEDEAIALLRWVESGGRLVLIDRRPDARLLPASGNWQVSTELLQYPTIDAHSGNAEEMTAGVEPAHATQPTALTRDVESVLPSRFAAVIRFTTTASDKNPAAVPYQGTGETTDESEREESGDEQQTGVETPTAAKPQQSTFTSPAPVVHLADKRGALLVDYKHGMGRIRKGMRDKR